jgi:hypothetical protein
MSLQRMYADALSAPRQAQPQSLEQQAQQLYQNLLSQGVDAQQAHAHVSQQYQAAMQQQRPQPENQMQAGDSLTNNAQLQEQGHGSGSSQYLDGAAHD